MKKKWPLLATMAVGVTGASVAALGYTLSNHIMYIKRKESELILQREIASKRLDVDWYKNVPKTQFSVVSPNGYTIDCQKINSIDSDNTVIIAHGVTETHVNSIKYAPLFARLGYNIVIFDQRRHGNTAGKTTSYGYYEKNDVAAIVAETRNMIGDEAILGLHGESMGAATILQYAGMNSSHIDFIIADCPFSDFTAQLDHIMKRDSPIHSPYAIKLADYFVQKRDGYRLTEVSPKQVIKNIQKPILFIHSEPDTYIPSSMSEELYHLKPTNKRLKIFPKGAHAQSFNEQPLEYENEIIRFLVDFNISYLPDTYVSPKTMHL